MKILPTKGADLKLFLVSLVLGFFSIFMTIETTQPSGASSFLTLLFFRTIYIMVTIRIVTWISKKIGLSK